MRSWNTLLLCCIPFFVGACAGGGGGGGGGSAPPPFVKFSSIAVPGSARISGNSQQASYIVTYSPQQVSSVSTPTTSNPGAFMDVTMNSARNITAITIQSANGTMASIGSATAGVEWTAGATSQTFVMTPSVSTVGWDYQTFGVWITGYNAGQGTAGAFSGGTGTAPAMIPTGGTATYNGLAGGIYVAAGGNAYTTQAAMTANVDFAVRSISFSSGAPVLVGLFDGIQSMPVNSLAMTGALGYSAGSNTFSGTVSTNSNLSGTGTMTGTAAGKFFGPTAQELGGTYAVTDGNGAHMIGGFGGKR